MSVDGRFVGCCVFASDHAASEWASFDVEPAYSRFWQRRCLRSSPPLPIPPLPVPQPPDLLPESRGQWPVPGGIITGRFGQTYAGESAPHTGLDIAAPAGTPVLCTWDGVVKWVDFEENGFGWYCRIWHPRQRLHWFYAHLRDEPALEIGDRVREGETIGYRGQHRAQLGPALPLRIAYRAPRSLRGYHRTATHAGAAIPRRSCGAMPCAPTAPGRPAHAQRSRSRRLGYRRCAVLGRCKALVRESLRSMHFVAISGLVRGLNGRV